MNINLSTFTELFALGMNPIPVLWDLEKRIVLKHPLHDTDVTDSKVQLADVERWLNNGMKDFNGIALKLYPPFGMLDFDLKNTKNKSVFNDWLNSVNSLYPDVLSKVCIETTRSGGYHVYIKYSKLDHKIPVARSEDGQEIISVYTGGLLSYCFPSPNYNIIHNDFSDIEELTDDEFEFLVSTAAVFNEDNSHVMGDTKIAVIDYPTEYENICLQFDNKITDAGFEQLLNSISLYKVESKQFERRKWLAYLRKGSVAAYSAKVYFRSRRVLIFSASFTKFPTWHDSAKSGDNTWSLSPSKILFYKNDKDWLKTIEELKLISDSLGIDIIEQPPVTQQPLVNEDRLKFPYDIFPEAIQNFIFSHKMLQHEYIAGFILPALSVAIGASAHLEALPGYNVYSSMYISVVASAGASKSPAMQAAFAPIEEYDSRLYSQFKLKRDQYRLELANYKKDKNSGTPEPVAPDFPQTLIKDSTIEKVIKILSVNPIGCCLYADELSGWLKRMNQYKSGDEVQKWLEMWSGTSILMQRLGRDEDRVEKPFCSVAGGIQPGVLEYISSKENEHNGFFHRFLFVYPVQEDKGGFGGERAPQMIYDDYANIFAEILFMRTKEHVTYKLMPDAFDLYKEWHDYKNLKYNASTSEQVRGIIAKYQNYCLRLALLIQVTHDRMNRKGHIERINVERAIRLTEYFFGNMHKALRILVPESPVDKLNRPFDEFYAALPNSFTIKTAQEVATGLKIKPTTAKTFIVRQTGKLFTKIEHGKYEKIY